MDFDNMTADQIRVYFQRINDGYPPQGTTNGLEHIEPTLIDIADQIWINSVTQSVPAETTTPTN